MMKTIKNYSNYAITKTGKVWSKNRNKFLKPTFSNKKMVRQRLIVNLCKNGAFKSHYIHQLVLKTFVGLCPAGMECRHLDGDHFNNNLGNLCWGTRSQNRQDAVLHGTHNTVKLTPNDVKKVRKMHATGRFTYKDISKLFGVWPHTVGKLIRGETWKFI